MAYNGSDAFHIRHIRGIIVSLNTEPAPDVMVFYLRIQAGEYLYFLQAFQANIYGISKHAISSRFCSCSKLLPHNNLLFNLVR
jgi:hypothetical protein